ncbi:MAG: hypothetical protein R3F56_06570 [Planctomycetota bacterium]
MSWVLPLVLWFFVAAWWFLADGWLAAAAGIYRPDLGVAFCLFAVFAARPGALPWLVSCAGLGRALVFGGAPALHVLQLGAPVALLFPLRRLALPPAFLHLAAAGLLAVLLPVLSWLLPAGGDPLPHAALPSLPALLCGMVATPLAAALLGRLPPLWFFREHRR